MKTQINVKFCSPEKKLLEEGYAAKVECCKL